MQLLGEALKLFKAHYNSLYSLRRILMVGTAAVGVIIVDVATVVVLGITTAGVVTFGMTTAGVVTVGITTAGVVTVGIITAVGVATVGVVTAGVAVGMAMVSVTSGFGRLGLGLQPHLKIFSASVSLMCTLVLSVASSTYID